MREFTNLLRCFIGINVLQGYRSLNFSSYFKLFIPRRNMICPVTSAENCTASAATASTSQEISPRVSEVVISIQNSPKKGYSNSKSQDASNGGSVFSETYAKSTASAADPQSNSTENSPNDSIAFDEFFHVSTGDSSFRGSCPMLAAHCGWLWDALDSPYSIPFWLLLMSAPIFAAVVGALYMNSCPGAVNLAIMIFAMGISYSFALILKICFILQKMLDEEENCKPLLKSIFGVTAVITIGLCMTESAYFWQMKTSQEPETSKYCDPQFMMYAFWWNCFMWFGIVIMFFCQG